MVLVAVERYIELGQGTSNDPSAEKNYKSKLVWRTRIQIQNGMVYGNPNPNWYGVRASKSKMEWWTGIQIENEMVYGNPNLNWYGVRASIDCRTF